MRKPVLLRLIRPVGRTATYAILGIQSLRDLQVLDEAWDDAGLRPPLEFLAEGPAFPEARLREAVDLVQSLGFEIITEGQIQ